MSQTSEPLDLQRGGNTLVRVMLMYLLPVAVIIAGAWGARHVYMTGPKAKQREPEQPAMIVQVMHIERSSVRPSIEAMGTVIAAQEVILQPRVSGEIVELSPHFVPGGRFQAGEVMLKIDPRDYELAVEKSGSQVAQAQYELKMELGAQKIAQREWELLDADKSATALDRELALRKPHRDKAEKALAAAQAAQKEAELNLERTTIRAPFIGIVTTENVDLGAQVTPQTQLGTLIGTDTYWVQVSVPVDRLKWINIPKSDSQDGSQVRIYQNLGDQSLSEWHGRVLRLLGDLEPQGRMARVLVEVRDPLGLESSEERSAHLLVGAYVNVEIEGMGLENMISIPRTALRDEESVWLMTDDNTLEIRPVDIAWRSRHTIVVSGGLTENERLVTSDLPAAVSEMKLRLAGAKPDHGDDDQLAESEQGQSDETP